MSLPERIIQGRYRVIYAIDEQGGVAVFCCRDDQSGSLVYVAEWTTSSSRIAVVRTETPGRGIVTATGPGTVKISAAVIENDSKTKGSADLVVALLPSKSLPVFAGPLSRSPEPAREFLAADEIGRAHV